MPFPPAFTVGTRITAWSLTRVQDDCVVVREGAFAGAGVEAAGCDAAAEITNVKDVDERAIRLPPVV